MEFLNYLSTNFPDGFIYVSLVWFIWIVARFYFVRFGGVEEAVKEQKKVHRSIIAKLDNIEKTLDRVVRYLSTRDSVEINNFQIRSYGRGYGTYSELFSVLKQFQ